MKKQNSKTLSSYSTVRIFQHNEFPIILTHKKQACSQSTCSILKSGETALTQLVYNNKRIYYGETVELYNVMYGWY